MNKINYFQQGGAASQQQDMQSQVIALVQAAMQGDQKATQTVNQIMEAAKAGDQKAIQIAQIIEQVVKQMQGQAVAAKYGAKLAYIQSLKCGGKSKKKSSKSCSKCEEGNQIEMNACGGKAKKKKKEQGGKVCKECEKGNKIKKPLISRCQYGGAIGFYRDWSEGDIKKLQMFLSREDMLGDDAYDGDYDGKIGPKTIAAIKAYQRKQGVTADGMWGTNTNKHHKVITSGIVSKSPYKNTHKYEAGNFRTYDVAGNKMKENDYYRAVQGIKERFYADPEAFWNDNGEMAKWREHFYKTPEGTALMEEFYGATPDDVKKKLGSRVTNRRMQQDKMDSGIREATEKAANVAVTKVLPTMAGIAAAPTLVMNPLVGLMGIGGSYVGGAVGRQVGENLSAGDTSAWTSVDGVGNVASVATPTSELVVPVTEALGTAIGGYAGWKLGQNIGKPSTEGLAEYRRVSNSEQAKTYRSQKRDIIGRFGKGYLGDAETLNTQLRLNDGTFGNKYIAAYPRYQAYLEGAGGNPSYTVVPIGMKNGGTFPKKKYFSWI